MSKRLLAIIHIALAAILSIAISGCAYGPRVHQELLPIVFVHGHGESSASWQDLVWRFESNGWPRERLFALQQPYPLARDDDAKPQPGHSSNAEQLAFVQAEVQRVLTQTGAKQLVLVGQGRGAFAVRNYILSGGEQTVSHAIFAQPDARWPGIKTPLALKDYDSAALKDVKSLVLPLSAQRDGAFSPAMFDASYAFVTGKPPASTAIWPQMDLVLDGVVTGMGVQPDERASVSNAFYNNLPLPKARVEVFAVSASSGLRSSGVLYEKTVGADGRWGPFRAQQGERYEFVLRAPGYAATHIYRSPFPRASQLVNLKASRIADADLPAFSITTLERLRGNLDPTVTHVAFDGQSPPPGVPVDGAGADGLTAVPTLAKITLNKLQNRALAAEIHTDGSIERVVGRTWPAKENQLVRLELMQ